MERAAALAGWDTYYEIVGCAAATLTGLQFLVITLIANRPRDTAADNNIATFGTPNIVHFGSALLISVIMAAPWPTLNAACFAVATLGLVGVVYAAITGWRAGHPRSGYQPVLEDWLFHVILPLVSYAALVVAGLAVPIGHPYRLFAVAGAAVLLMFVGIHNTWDTVVYLVTQAPGDDAPASKPDGKP